MLADSQALSSDCATDVDTSLSTYVRNYADAGRSVFSVAGLTLPASQILSIGHEVTKAGNQRHLVRDDQTVVDALLVPATLGVYLVIDRPANTAITNAIVLGSVNRIVDFLIEGGSNANVTKVLNNEL